MIDTSKLRNFEGSLRELPRVLALKVAAESADTITSLSRETFGASENAYGDAWAPGADGKRVTLRKSGKIAAGVRFVAVGTKLRAIIGPRYAKYQLGKRPIFPRGKLPVRYIEALGGKARELIARELAR